MVAPLFKLGLIGHMEMILIAILVGIVFGYLLQSVGMGNSRKIAAVFYGEDWAVMRIMFTAVVTAMLLIFLFYYLGVLDLSLVQLSSLHLGSQIIGGLLLGAGMAIGGYCPGTSIVAGAAKRIDAWIFILGFFVGVLIYAQAYTLVFEPLLSASSGKMTLASLFGLPYGIVVLLVVIIAFITFHLLGKIEGRMYGRI